MQLCSARDDEGPVSCTPTGARRGSGHDNRRRRWRKRKSLIVNANTRNWRLLRAAYGTNSGRRYLSSIRMSFLEGTRQPSCNGQNDRRPLPSTARRPSTRTAGASFESLVKQAVPFGLEWDRQNFYPFAAAVAGMSACSRLANHLPSRDQDGEVPDMRGSTVRTINERCLELLANLTMATAYDARAGDADRCGRRSLTGRSRPGWSC